VTTDNTTGPTGSGVTDRDREAVLRFVERFAGELAEGGMQRMAARVFAALLASDEGALTSTELAEQLRISPAAVSGAIRYLNQVGMVRREREPGSRRDRYSLHGHIWYEAFSRRDVVLSRWGAVLEEGVESLGRETPAGRRIAESAEFFAFVQKEIPLMLERWRAQRDDRAAQDS
jgi:DNA-binding transcriptional regulator GbsR (MarR family)